MSDRNSIECFRSMGLLPFQASFAHEFMSSDRGAWELVSPVGTGKTQLGRVLVEHVAEDAHVRILVLAPGSALAAHWADTLAATAGVKPILIDRGTFLELEGRAESPESIWPQPGIVVMPIELATRADVAIGLAATEWSLVIADESHLLIDEHHALVDRLRESSVRLLLLTSTPSTEVKGTTRRVVDTDSISDWGGRRLFDSRRRRSTILEFSRSGAERAFLRQLVDFSNTLAEYVEGGLHLASLIQRGASSCMYSAESMLRRLQQSWRPMRNKIAHGMEVNSEDLESGERLLVSALEEITLPQTLGPSRLDPSKVLKLFHELEALLGRVDEVDSDPKLDAMSAHIRERWNAGERHVCVWTSFGTTARYLISALEELQIPLQDITGSIGPEERAHVLDEYETSGGILIATDVASEGVGLSYVDECVSYDLPWKIEGLEVRWGRFDRVSRQKEFGMVFLRDTSSDLAWEEMIFRILGKSSHLGD